MAPKAESEKAIRSLASKWAALQQDRHEPHWHPSFRAFCDWLNANGYGGWLNFRSASGPLYDAEVWFDEELKQTWRR